MNEAFEIEQIPELHDTLLIAGFDGWGNALDISRGMVDYMIRKLEAKPFASIKTDRWEEVPLDRLRVSFAPQRDARFALGFSVSF